MEPNSPAPASDDLKATYAALQQQVTILLVALLVVSCTLMVYFWRQQRMMSTERDALRAPAMQAIQGFQQDKPRFEAFLLKVVDYGQTHPDFKPIIDKYHLARVTSASAPAKP